MNGNAIEILIGSLNCMKFRESEFGVKLTDNIFRTANKDLFRRIVCFTLCQFGEFDDFVGKYKCYSLSAKFEAQFRTSLKSVVSTINGLYPGEYYLKPVNQSFLIAPQGPKIIDFLSSLSKIALSVKLKRVGYEFIPPRNVEEYIKFLDENELEELEDINVRLEKAEAQVHQAPLNDAESHEEFVNYLKLESLLNELKNKLELESVEMIVEKWEQSLIVLLKNTEGDIEKKKVLLNQLIGMIDSFKKLKNSTYFSFDGLTVLNDLGFKSNISAIIHDVELIENGMLDLNSLLKAASAKYKKLMEYVKLYGSSTLKSKIDELKNEILIFDQIKTSSFEEIEVKLNEIIDNYMPSVRKHQEETVKMIYQAEHPLQIRLREYIEFEKSIPWEKPLCDVKPPSCLPIPEEDLVKWILGDKEDKLEESPVGSVRKCSSKLVRNLSFSGRKLSRSILKRKTGCEEKKGAIVAKGILFRGLCEDRRATLASPSARRERFKIKRFDDQRKPLKPMTSKSLFFSSSPLGHSSTAKTSSTTLDLSPVKCSTDLQAFSPSFLAEGCSNNLNRSLSEPALDLTHDMLKWENLTSDLDLEDSITPPVASSNLPHSSHDDSVERLIWKFKTAKEKLNLSE